MRTSRYEVWLESTSPYSQSKNIDILEHPKVQKEGPEDYENRTWYYRLHMDENKNIMIPIWQFKEALSNAAKLVSKKIPGQRNATYTKHFVCGLFIESSPVLPFKLSDVLEKKWFQRLFVPSDGVKGGGKRVWKFFPVLPEWSAKISIMVLDALITEEVLLEHLQEAGKLVGIGRSRPQTGGVYGRFKVVLDDPKRKPVWTVLRDE